MKKAELEQLIEELKERISDLEFENNELEERIDEIKKENDKLYDEINEIEGSNEYTLALMLQGETFWITESVKYEIQLHLSNNAKKLLREII